MSPVTCRTEDSVSAIQWLGQRSVGGWWWARNCLTHLVQEVDLTNIGDQELFWKLSRVVLAFCYIPPTDSPYFPTVFFAALQEKLSSGCGVNEHIIIGRKRSIWGHSEAFPHFQSRKVFISSHTRWCQCF